MSDLGERHGLGRRSRQAAAVLTAVAACLVVTGCAGVASVVNGGASAQAPTPATSTASAGSSGTDLKLIGAPAASAFASTAGRVVPPNPLRPPADPFTGTPADHWADGAAGIVLPTAEPIGPFTRAQVKNAYGMMRKLLVAGYLDKQTLLGGAPTAFEDLLTSQQKAWFVAGLDKQGLDKQGRELNTRDWVMLFAPGSAQLIGSVVKVNGTMHARAIKNSGGQDELDISVDYIFVYPIEPPHQPGDWMRVVSEVTWTVGFANWDGAASSFAPWLISAGAGGSVAGADCGTTDGFSHPAYPSHEAQPTVTPTGAPIDPYVAGQAKPGNCAGSTGT